MNTKHQLILIDGAFIPEDGKEILTNIFSSKISFHQMKNFSSQERFGVEDAMAKTRIPALKDEIKKLENIIVEANAKNKTLAISAVIDISIVDRD